LKRRSGEALSGVIKQRGRARLFSTLPAWENSPPTARSVIIANACERSKPQQNKNHTMLLTRAGKDHVLVMTVALPAHKTKIVATIGPRRKLLHREIATQEITGLPDK